MSTTETTARDAVAQARRNYFAAPAGPQQLHERALRTLLRSRSRRKASIARFNTRRAAVTASLAIAGALLLAPSPAMAQDAARPGFAELCVAVHGVGYCRTLARAIRACRSAEYLWACVGRQSYHEQITDSGVTIFRGGQ